METETGSRLDLTCRIYLVNPWYTAVSKIVVVPALPESSQKNKSGIKHMR